MVREIEDKHLQAKCRNLLAEFEDILIIVQKEEEIKLRMMDIDDKEQYMFLKKSFFNKGVIEGMKRLIAKIHEKSR